MPKSHSWENRLGVVIIGRNEGERLVNCLKSLLCQYSENVPIVYVDSGSTDGSVETAKALGIHVLSLDPSLPFTAARGRNTGWKYLLEHFPSLVYVQFIDGDCELLPNWLEIAIATLDEQPELAIACGRRRERFPEVSPYNRLADLEWNTTIGQANACGGDALMRIKAIQEVNGYNPSLICGEEPEMCFRLRQRGWKIQRLDLDMTLHDAAMLYFSQWWKRSVRAGWFFAEGVALYGSSPERYLVREQRSSWLWGFFLPLGMLLLAWLTLGISLLVLLSLYLVLMVKIYRYRRHLGDLPPHARLYACFCVLAKFPELLGQCQYWLTRWQGKTATLIEYKEAEI